MVEGQRRGGRVVNREKTAVTMEFSSCDSPSVYALQLKEGKKKAMFHLKIVSIGFHHEAVQASTPSS